MGNALIQYKQIKLNNALDENNSSVLELIKYFSNITLGIKQSVKLKDNSHDKIRRN